MLFELFVALGGVLSPLAALIAFLISYNEWRKHKLQGWPLWREPLRLGAFAFAIFFGLCLTLGLLLPALLRS